jgi:hypothetical protein
VAITVALVDYDRDNNGLLEVRGARQLSAMVWNLDCDAAPVSNKRADCETAFHDAVAGMGCGSGGTVRNIGVLGAKSALPVRRIKTDGGGNELIDAQ